MKVNGCASPVFNMSHFIGYEFEEFSKYCLDATVTVTEEGTGESFLNTYCTLLENKGNVQVHFCSSRYKQCKCYLKVALRSTCVP